MEDGNMPKIDGNKNFFTAGRNYITDLMLETFGDKLNKINEEAYTEAFELGISKTIASLYDTNVKDKEIIRALNKYWGINTEEAEKRIIFEKSQVTIRELRQYLRLQGLSEMKINEFMRTNRVPTKIKNNNELWELRNKPEMLLKQIQDSD